LEDGKLPPILRKAAKGSEDGVEQHHKKQCLRPPGPVGDDAERNPAQAPREKLARDDHAAGVGYEPRVGGSDELTGPATKRGAVIREVRALSTLCTRSNTFGSIDGVDLVGLSDSEDLLALGRSFLAPDAVSLKTATISWPARLANARRSRSWRSQD
jgi:hypothetical protein